MIRAGLLAATVLGSAALGFPQTPHRRAQPVYRQAKQLNIDSFEYVWKAIRDKHWQ